MKEQIKTILKASVMYDTRITEDDIDQIAEDIEWRCLYKESKSNMKIAQSMFDKGFNISNEKFNAEFRDDYDIWDQEDKQHYEDLKYEAIAECLINEN